MDERLRRLERQCYGGDLQSCYRAFIQYRQLGIPAEEIPPAILYGGTRIELEIQPHIDFRDLIDRMPAMSGYRAGGPFGVMDGLHFNHIFFNEEANGEHYWISIQASSDHYSIPRENLDKWDYTDWEIYTGFAPVRRETLWDPLDDDAERLARYREDPLVIEINWESPEDEAEITFRDPRFELGGVLYGFPHEDVFSVYDEGVGPYVPTEKVQDIVDFMRARFGLFT